VHAVQGKGVWQRLTICGLLACLIGLRVLTPAGFMPAFDKGRLTIVACPDDNPVLLGGHHHHPARQAHEHCPFAALASLGAVGPDTPALAGPIAVQPEAAADLHRGAPPEIATRQRPPARGPPLPV
jgi:hypothetical protein